MLTGPLLGPLVGTVQSMASNAAHAAGEAARRTAKDVAFLTIGALLLMAGLGFLAAAAFIGLAQEVGSAWAAAIVGLVLMISALPLFWVATRPKARVYARPVVAPIAPVTAPSDQTWGSIAAAFAAGIGAAALLKKK
jgi:hypothetical protein